MARRSIAPHGEHIYQFGVVGRKTGVTVPDSGVRDEHGMEPLDNLFSSPSKSDHDQEEEVSVESNSGDEAMDITASMAPNVLRNQI
jgi:centromere protein C